MKEHLLHFLENGLVPIVDLFTILRLELGLQGILFLQKISQFFMKLL